MWFRNKVHELQRRFRPQVERLEGRCLPAVTITPGIFNFGNETIRIVSNNASDNIDIEDNGGSIEVTVNGVSRGTFGGPQLRAVEIFLRGGADILDINLEDSTGIERSYTVNTGKGNDRVFIDLDDTDLQSQGFVNFLIIDGGDNDFVELEIDGGADIEENSTLKFVAVMGGGNDHVVVNLQENVADGSSLHINLDMGGGNDRFDFLQDDDAEIIAGAVDVNVVMGKGNDDVEAYFGEDYDNFGNMQFTVALGSGNDDFLATFSLDQFDVNEGGGADGAAFNLTVFGESGNDEIRAVDDNDTGETITVNATVFDIHFYGGTGRDIIEVLFDEPGGSLQGVGGIVIFIDGWTGNDTITLRLTSDGSNTFDVTVLAGRGNDTVTFFGDESGGETYLGDGVLLDGGFGRDERIIELGTDMDNKRRNFEFGVGP
jgi:hypothetical protein